MGVHTYQVTQGVEVEVDESKFTPEFMEEFRESFFPFDTIDDHREYLAELYARGGISGFPTEFIEGYGPAKDFGISLKIAFVETEQSA
jgi:hypothetical protein